MAEKKIITPDDPSFYDTNNITQIPLVMGDPYDNDLIPKLAAKYKSHKYSDVKYANSDIAHCPENWYKMAQVGGANNITTQPMWFSPLHTPQSWQVASKRRETYAWSRHFYECFVADTPILLLHGERNISEIKPGMQVIAGDGSTQKVLNVFHRVDRENILYIHLSDREKPLRCTKNHVIPRVLQDAETNEEIWGPAETLTTDCYLFCPGIDGEPKKWKKIIKIEEKPHHGVFYDLEVENVHSYIANGCVVHNSEPKVAAAIDFYCFTPTMQVLLADGTQKPISLINPDDMVRSHDGTANKVIHKFKRQAAEGILKIFFAGKHSDYIQTTYGHEFLIDVDGEFRFVQASELKQGDYLLSPINYQENLYSQEREYDGCFVKGNYLYRKILNIECKNYEGTVYDLEIENSHSYVVNHIAVHNSRFPQNGFKLEYPEGTRADGKQMKKVLAFFEHHVVKKLKLAEKMKQMSSEYFMLGDVFTHCNIACESCRGTARDIETGEECYHNGGMISSLTIFNPDWIEVQQSPLSDDPVMVMIPDEQVQQIVHKKQPKDLYDRIPDHIKGLVLARKPIPLSNKTTFHLKHMGSPYGSYGSSLIRRLFTTLAYKTKIMTANWIVAERMILPIRIAKVGSDERPATVADIADIQQQLAATANEPNLVIITHNNFEMDFIGASGKILQVTQEMEHIDKEILDGMMLNQALLNGEAPSYSSAQVGVETLIRRIESWRNTLAETIEDNVFKPLAEMQGFIDEQRSEEVGEVVFLYPRIKWNDLELKDKSQWHQILMQLHDKQVISTQTLCEELELNYDQEVRRMRYEQIAVGPAGGALGGGAGGAGQAGGMGAGGGGAAGGGAAGAGGGAGGTPGPMDAGGAGIGLGGGGGADMGGGMGGMMGGGGGGGGGGMGGPMASGMGGGGGKILKKGKSNKEAEQEMPVAMPVKLTKIEQSMAQMMEEICDAMNINTAHVRMQYPIPNPRGGKPFMLDFAMPNLKICAESNGSYWHSQPQQIAHDKERDNLLAQRGWTVLRFDDNAIEDSPQAVKATISSHIQKAMSHHKKASTEDMLGQLFFFSGISGELQEMYDSF